MQVAAEKGGKSHFTRVLKESLSASVIVLSDTVAAVPDTAGQNVMEILKEANFDSISYQVIPDSPEQLLTLIEQQKKSVSADSNCGRYWLRS